MKMKENRECAICTELSGTGNTRLSNALDDSRLANAALVVSDHFAVIPSVGPLVAGHSLVATRQHSSNVIAGLSRPELDELIHVCEEASNRLLPGDPEVRLFCFEHGSRCELRNTLCSTAHGHLHQLPLREKVISAVIRSAAGREFEVSSICDLPEVLRTLQEYIVAFSLRSDASDGLKGIVMDASDVPSQYFRKLIAAELGISTRWNWKTDMNPDLLRETLALGFTPNRPLSTDIL